MSFPDGRIKEGVFENNIYKYPSTDMNKLKTQAVLMK